MTYKAKVAVCSDIRTEHSTKSTMQNFWMLNLVVSRETARIWKVKVKKNPYFLSTECIYVFCVVPIAEYMLYLRVTLLRLLIGFL